MPRPRLRQPLTALIVVAAIAASCSGTSGGFSPVPGGSAPTFAPSDSAVPSTSPEPTTSPEPSQTASATPSPAPSPTPTPSPTAPPTPSLTPSPTPSPTPIPTPTPIPSPSATPDPYAGVLFECFGIAFPSEALLGPGDARGSTSAGEFIRWLNEDADETFPRDGWRLLTEVGDAALYGVRAPEGNEAPAFVVTIRRVAGEWQAEDSGACTPTIRLAEDIGPATWLLVDADDIDPDTDRFDVLVTERACASGQSSEDRLVAPRINVDDDAITIIFGVTSLEGPQDCQGNPPTEYRVELPEPLGDRELRDGGVYPPVTVYP